MAKVTLKHPVDSITGAIIKGGIIYRKKNYKDLNGKNIAQGAKEVYLIRQPRNYKTNPTTIAEKNNKTSGNKHAISHNKSLKHQQQHNYGMKNSRHNSQYQTNYHLLTRKQTSQNNIIE